MNPDAINNPVTVRIKLHVRAVLRVSAVYETIQAAIDDANDYDMVLVADGSYSGEGNRDLDFKGKAITVRSANGPNNCIIDCNGTKDDPHRGFYFHSGEDANSSLAGFTIVNGYATWDGGGIYCSESSPTIANCIINDNLALGGGGIFCGHSSPTIANCTITGNSANSGGGIFSWTRSPIISNCTISGNWVTYSGGGIYCLDSSLTITNCTISGNRAGHAGGAIYCEYSNPTITNCTIVENSASDEGGGIRCGDNIRITNCILWGNSPQQIYPDGGTASVSWSDVQDDWPGDGNIDADPCFIELGYWADVNDPNIPGDLNDPYSIWVDGDYHLLVGSPCINAGDPYGDYAGQTDIDGQPRVINGRIDIGADEYVPRIPAEVDIKPDTINLTSKGKWITCHIRLPDGYNVADIDLSSVRLEDEIEAELAWVNEQGQIATARFGRSEVQCILEAGEAELTVSGELTDGTVFEGTDVIRVIDKGGRKLAK